MRSWLAVLLAFFGRLLFHFLFLVVTGALSACSSFLPISSEELNDSWQGVRNQAFEFNKAGEKAKAAECYRKAVSIAEKFGEKDSRLAASYSELADFYSGENKAGEAFGNYAKALAIYEQELASSQEKASDDSLLLATQVIANKTNFAKLLYGQKRYVEAEKQYTTALEVAKRYVVPTETLQSVVTNYSALLCELKREKEAKKLEECWGQVRSIRQEE